MREINTENRNKNKNIGNARAKKDKNKMANSNMMYQRFSNRTNYLFGIHHACIVCIEKCCVGSLARIVWWTIAKRRTAWLLVSSDGKKVLALQISYRLENEWKCELADTIVIAVRQLIRTGQFSARSIDTVTYLCVCVRSSTNFAHKQSTAFFCKQLFYDGIIVKPQIREYLSCLVNHSSCSMDTLTFVVSWKKYLLSSCHNSFVFG